MTREEAISTLESESCYECTWGCESPTKCTCPKCNLKSAIKVAIEALEEKRPHGEWKIDSEYGYIFHCVCSKCNTDVMKYISGSENWWLNSVPYFCPNCGASMRKEGERE